MNAAARPIRLAEVLGTLSLATDLSNGQVPEQCLRTALVATRLAADASPVLRADVYWTAVLRYIGCNGFAVEEAVFGAGDDIGLRASFVRVDFGRPAQFVGAVLRDVGRGAPWPRRARGVAALLGSPSAPLEHARAQCDAGMHLARRLGMSAAVVEALGQADERFDGRGLPRHLAGDALSEVMRHVELARVAVVFHGIGGIATARAEIGRRAAGHLDPDLAQRFDADAPRLLAGLDRTSVWDEFLAADPSPRELAEAELEPLFETFALFADLKWSYGAGHSGGVAALAAAAAREQGLDAAETAALSHAALLHDLGRVCVPTGLWDKPGPLTAPEWERVRLHSYFTERVLRHSPSLGTLADIAGRAHERLDGSGYPRGERAPSIARAVRLLAAADTYRACREARPHRDALVAAAAERELRADVQQGRLCPHAADAVLAASGHARAHRARPSHALTERELEVIRLLATGRTNKQIARVLGISPRTVQHHTLHIYEKIGVQSRAGAALYAAEHGLAAGADA